LDELSWPRSIRSTRPCVVWLGAYYSRYSVKILLPEAVRHAIFISAVEEKIELYYY
jgi:hypothetical protein